MSKHGKARHTRRKRKEKAARKELATLRGPDLRCMVCGDHIKDDDPVIVRGGLRHAWCQQRA